MIAIEKLWIGSCKKPSSFVVVLYPATAADPNLEMYDWTITLEKETILFCRAAGIPIEIILDRMGFEKRILEIYTLYSLSVCINSCMTKMAETSCAKVVAIPTPATPKWK